VLDEIKCVTDEIVRLVEVLKIPRWEDYDIDYMHQNPWAALGMGRTFLDKAQDKSLVDMSPYIQLENIDPEWLKAIGFKQDTADPQEDSANEPMTSLKGTNTRTASHL
jgi:hydroxyversicolorone monooxygenase